MGVQTWGRWTGPARLEGGDDLGTQIPFYDEFQLGGLFELSGRPRGPVTGQTYAIGGLLLYRRMNSAAGAIIMNLYVGLSAKAGNAWEDRSAVSFSHLKTAGSVYVIAETILGPFFFGYGRAGSKNTSFYMLLNRAF